MFEHTTHGLDRVKTAASSTSHEPNPPHIVQAFDSALAQTQQINGAAVVVYHGEQVHLPGFKLRASFRELGVVMTHVSGPDDVTLDALLEGLTAETGHAFKVFRHGADLNEKVARLLIRPHTSRALHDVASQVYPDYAALADACIVQPGALVIGLRGPAAANSQLKVVTVNGRDPRESLGPKDYPLQYWVHLYVRGAASAADHSAEVAFTQSILRRRAEDAAALSWPA